MRAANALRLVHKDPPLLLGWPVPLADGPTREGAAHCGTVVPHAARVDLQMTPSTSSYGIMSPIGGVMSFAQGMMVTDEEG